MPVTPIDPAGRHFIEGYGAGRFRIAGVDHRGPVLVLRTRTVAWAVAEMAQLSAASLQPVIDAGDISVLLLGCGTRMSQVPPTVRESLRAAGVVIEPMDTGSACRTYNVLLAEDRQVGAALIPLP